MLCKKFSYDDKYIILKFNFHILNLSLIYSRVFLINTKKHSMQLKNIREDQVILDIFMLYIIIKKYILYENLENNILELIKCLK